MRWKKIWHFIWKDDSILSWIVNLILAFVIIKYALFPTLALIFGAELPLVAIVSESMEHDGSFDAWWTSQACLDRSCTQEEWYKSHTITKTEFKEFPWKNGLNKGDIMVVWGHSTYEKGDVLIFKANRAIPIIHRIISEKLINDTYYYQTKGDHNIDIYDAIHEDSIHEERVIGKAVFRIPYAGYVKIWFTEAIQGMIKVLT